MYVSINGHTIRGNAKHGRNDPPIRIARTPSDSKPVYAHEITLGENSRLVYDPEKAIMRCGARLVIVTDSVEVVR